MTYEATKRYEAKVKQMKATELLTEFAKISYQYDEKLSNGKYPSSTIAYKMCVLHAELKER